MLAKSTGGAMVKAGGDSWYFITADYAFGKQLQSDTTAFINEAGGKVMGAVAVSVPGHHRFLVVPGAGAVQRRESLGLAQRRRRHGELDQAGQRIRHQPVDEGRGAADVHHRRACAGPGRRAGPQPDRKLLLGPERPARARSPSGCKPKSPNNWPNMAHAGCYSATLHYLKAAHDMGAAEAKKDGVATVNRMKAMPVDDDCFGKTQDPRGWPQPGPGLPVRGEKAIREQRSVGLLQAGVDDTGR